jgi:drug/metabolite transporter (DMT)-like permease
LATGGIRAEVALGLRFAISAAILVLLGLVTRQALLPVRGERLAVFLLGALGYALESTFFFLGLERGTAAAVGLVFYSYPAMVAAVELLTGAARPTVDLFAAIVLCSGGVALVIATGAEVTISASGVGFSLLAAVAFTAYFLAGNRYATRTPPVLTATWVAIGASVSLLGRAAALGALSVPAERLGQLIAYGLATALAFGCMFASLRLLGPTRTAVMLTFEVFATVVLAWVFLDESLRPLQLVGGAAIAAGAVLVARAGAEPAPEPPPP